MKDISKKIIEAIGKFELDRELIKKEGIKGIIKRLNDSGFSVSADDIKTAIDEAKELDENKLAAVAGGEEFVNTIHKKFYHVGPQNGMDFFYND